MLQKTNGPDDGIISFHHQTLWLLILRYCPLHRSTAIFIIKNNNGLVKNILQCIPSGFVPSWYHDVWDNDSSVTGNIKITDHKARGQLKLCFFSWKHSFTVCVSVELCHYNIWYATFLFGWESAILGLGQRFWHHVFNLVTVIYSMSCP